MGISKLLKASEGENDLIKKEVARTTQKSNSIDAKVSDVEEIKTPSLETMRSAADDLKQNSEVNNKAKDSEPVSVKADNDTAAKNEKITTESKDKAPARKKTMSINGKVIGRRPNAEKGIENRKQYSITLKEATYEEALRRAIDEDIPFAKYVERAVLEYMKTHYNKNQ